MSGQVKGNTAPLFPSGFGDDVTPRQAVGDDAVAERRWVSSSATSIKGCPAAAAEAFARHGFTATSITQIAAAARVTKGAVYHHFSDKRSLFEAVMHEYNEAAQQRVHDAAAKHPDDVWEAATAALDATLDVCADPVAGRLIYLEGPIGLGWRRWRESERQYTHRNVRQLLVSGIQAGIFPDDIPIDAMTEVIAGMITHAGIALAEAPIRQRKRIRGDLQAAIDRVLGGLR
jgi:AcrR family transcriptional regulator